MTGNGDRHEEPRNPGDAAHVFLFCAPLPPREGPRIFPFVDLPLLHSLSLSGGANWKGLGGGSEKLPPNQISFPKNES